MPPRNDNNVMIEGATIIFRNFAGRETQYNSEGDRNFCIVLPEQLAQDMLADGWNVRRLRAQEEGEEGDPYVQVSVGYGKGRPPLVVLVTSRGRTQLDETLIEALDWVDIETADIIIRPYDWRVGGKGGRKAYLKTLFIVVREDPLDLKYRDLDELPASAGRVIDSPNIVEGEVVEKQFALEGLPYDHR